MSRVARAAEVGDLGVDCVTVIATSLMADKLRAAGFKFAARYLGSLSNPEIDILHSAGMGVMPVTYSRAPGWMPTAAMGASDAKGHLTQLVALGIPKGVTVGLDVEGPGGHAQDVIDFVTAWAAPIKAAGYDAGAYFGYGTKLTSEELYKLPVDKYWHSLSKVTDSAGQLAEPTCGWCIYQLHPSVMRAGVWVDIDVVQEDYQGRVPMMCAKG